MLQMRRRRASKIRNDPSLALLAKTPDDARGTLTAARSARKALTLEDRRRTTRKNDVNDLRGRSALTITRNRSTLALTDRDLKEETTLEGLTTTDRTTLTTDKTTGETEATNSTILLNSETIETIKPTVILETLAGAISEMTGGPKEDTTETLRTTDIKRTTETPEIFGTIETIGTLVTLKETTNQTVTLETSEQIFETTETIEITEIIGSIRTLGIPAILERTVIPVITKTTETLVTTKTIGTPGIIGTTGTTPKTIETSRTREDREIIETTKIPEDMMTGTTEGERSSQIHAETNLHLQIGRVAILETRGVIDKIGPIETKEM